MSDATQDLIFRSATAADWLLVKPIVEGTFSWGDYIDEEIWKDWTSAANDRPSHAIIAERHGQIAGLARLVELGPAEWWLEGMRVAEVKRGQGVGRLLLGHMVELYRKHGEGLLRFVTDVDNDAMKHLARQAGFRQLNQYAPMTASPERSEYRQYRVLQAGNLEMAMAYLKRSPMYRTSHFVERDWSFYFLTKQRLATYFDDDMVEVLGWRQMDSMHGVAVLMNDDDQDEERIMRAGYLDASSDTTLRAMIVALRGLAASRQYDRVTWMMPVGIGVEQAAADSGLSRISRDDIVLFELPIRA